MKDGAGIFSDQYMIHSLYSGRLISHTNPSAANPHKHPSVWKSVNFKYIYVSGRGKRVKELAVSAQCYPCASLVPTLQNILSTCNVDISLLRTGGYIAMGIRYAVTVINHNLCAQMTGLP